MAELPLAVSPLAGLPVTAFGSGELALAERRQLGKIMLRGNAADARFVATVVSALGCVLPELPGAGAVHGLATILCLAPDEWLVVSEAGAPDLGVPLRQALAGDFAAVVDASSAMATVGARGRLVPELLRKVCSIDLARQPACCCCWQTRLGPYVVLIHRRDAAEAFDLHIARSYARSFWLWLNDAATEWTLVTLAYNLRRLHRLGANLAFA